MGADQAEPFPIQALEMWLSEKGGGASKIRDVAKLSGGAIQENYRFTLDVMEGEWQGAHDLVLRKDAPSAVATSLGRVEEFKLLKAAHKAGVAVPKPCIVGEGTGLIGTPFFVMHLASGETAGHKLVKKPADAELVHDIGANVARLHKLTPNGGQAVAGLGFLPRPDGTPADAAIITLRQHLDALPDPHPAVEWGLTWLAQNSPMDQKVVLCHRDYRTGNLMIDDGQLTAVLDWEFAGWSDPLEDLGWFCAKCWRFGRWNQEAGGLGPRDAFYDGYEAEAGYTIDRDAVFYWEVMAHVRWAVIALQQAHRHVSGQEANLELALTAHVVPELEWEILEMTGA